MAIDIKDIMTIDNLMNIPLIKGEKGDKRRF